MKNLTKKHWLIIGGAAAVLLAVLIIVLVVSCSGNNDSDDDNDGDQTPVETEYKLGMGVVVGAEGSVDKGVFQVDSTVATVVLEGNKIVACRIDSLQNKATVEDGVLTSKNTTSKAELKENYNMAKYGQSMDWNGDGKVLEWYLQAQAFENYVVGMTATEVAAIATAATGPMNYVIATDKALLDAGCTIQIAEFKDAVVKACNDAQGVTFKTSKAFTLGVAVNGEIDKHSDKFAEATAEKAGAATLFSEYAATVVVDGKIVAALNDAIQPVLAFNADNTIGALTYSATKRELKENYNMAKYGQSMDWNKDSKVLEWYLQSMEFSKFVVGMTKDEVLAMGTQVVEGMGYVISNNADLLAAGCTIQITGMKAVVADAVANAR